MTTNNPTRRTFVFGAAALAVGAACGVAARPFSTGASVLRPPGGHIESNFMAKCVRCERCISACPTDVLYPLGIEQGVMAVKTPAITYSAGSCTFCNKCTHVCPTEALSEVDPYAPLAGRIGCAHVLQDKCLAFIEPGACGICVDACPYNALSFDGERRPRVDANLCNGCGECVRVCPANVNTSFSGGEVRGIEVLPDSKQSKG